MKIRLRQRYWNNDDSNTSTIFNLPELVVDMAGREHLSFNLIDEAFAPLWQNELPGVTKGLPGYNPNRIPSLTGPLFDTLRLHT